MRKFNINVNGKAYQVGVEEIAATMSMPVSKTTVAPRTTAAPAPKPKTSVSTSKPSAPVPEGGNTVTAPMPGTILDIKVGAGDTVYQGDVLLILEAMKMENEITAPASGKVVSVNVSNDTSVNAGDVLIVLR
ncbi:MAG: biotin/lipoyl-binding protein [Clostridia bacterium]|nr:biotin/lipoyl-binding protein [Clostridia bacterium]